MQQPVYQTCSLFRVHLHVASVQQHMVEFCMKHLRIIDLAKTNYYKMVQVTKTNQLDIKTGRQCCSEVENLCYPKNYLEDSVISSI